MQVGSGTPAPGYLITLKVALRPVVNSGGDEDASLTDFNASIPTFQTKMQLGFKGPALKTI